MDEISSPANFQGDDFEIDDEAMNGENDTGRPLDLEMDDESINGEDETRRLSIGAFEDSRLSDGEPLKVSVQKVTSENTKRSSQKQVNKVSKHGLKYKS